MNTIKEFLVNLRDKINPHIKINLIVVLLSIAAFILFSLWLLPKERENDNTLSAKYEQIAKDYDSQNQDYNNPGKVSQLQQQVEEIKSDGQITKLLKVIFISTILVALAGTLGNFLQYIYTIIPFAKLIKDNITPEASKVLSAALLSASLIVCFVFTMVFWIN